MKTPDLPPSGGLGAFCAQAVAKTTVSVRRNRKMLFMGFSLVGALGFASPGKSSPVFAERIRTSVFVIAPEQPYWFGKSDVNRNAETCVFCLSQEELSMNFKQRFSKFLDQVSKHEVFILASSIAYTTGLALAPFVLILLSLATLFGEGTRDKIFAGFADVVGQQASGSIQLIVENAEKNPQGTGISGVIGFVVLLISASAIFSQLRYALDKINEHKASEQEQGVMGFVKDRFLSMGLLLGFVFLTITSMLLTTALMVVFPAQQGWFWQSLVFVITLMVFAGLFTAIYRFVPSDKASWKRCAVAGVTSTVFFNIGRTLIGLYLGTAGLEKSYGAAGSLVVFLAWVYYSALTLLVSYEFANQVLLRDKSPQAEVKSEVAVRRPPDLDQTFHWPVI